MGHRGESDSNPAAATYFALHGNRAVQSGGAVGGQVQLNIGVHEHGASGRPRPANQRADAGEQLLASLFCHVAVTCS